MLHDTGVSIPTHTYPAPTPEFTRHEIETRHGVLEHRAHEAESHVGEATSEAQAAYWRGVAAAHRHDAADLAVRLGWTA